MNLSKDIVALEKTIGMFQEKEDRILLTGNAFFQFSTTLHVQRAMAADKPTDSKYLFKTYGYFSSVIQDIWNIALCVDRLEMMRNLPQLNDPLFPSWNYYAALDIEHVHFELRSIMNYTTQIIAGFCKASTNLPKSFRVLMQGLKDEKKSIRYEKMLGPELCLLLKSVYWFYDVKDIRDAIGHDGAFVLVFGRPAEGILFQAIKDYKNLVKDIPYCFEGKNELVNFKKYIALCFARLLSFLDELGEYFYSKHPDFNKIDGYTTSPGFKLLYQWMNELLGELKNNI